jgi:hypothetical protein
VLSPVLGLASHRAVESFPTTATLFELVGLASLATYATPSRGRWNLRMNGMVHRYFAGAQAQFSTVGSRCGCRKLEALAGHWANNINQVRTTDQRAPKGPGGPITE